MMTVQVEADDRNLGVGVGYQSLGLTYPESDTSQWLTGPSVHLTAAHEYLRIGGTVYQTVDQADETVRIDGLALDIHTGLNLDRTGWTAFAGIGHFQETWLENYQPRLEAVAYHLSFGGGYHFNRCSLEAELKWRGNPYADIDQPPEGYMAAGLKLSARF